MSDSPLPPNAPNSIARNVKRFVTIVASVFLILFGGIFVIFGWLAGKQASGASATPVPVDLAKLEAGEPLPNIHVQLAKHVRDYPHCFFWYETKDHAPPKPDSMLKSTYVPLVSPSSDYAVRLQELAKRHGGLDKVPSNELPPLKNFVMLLRTDQYDTVGNIPKHAELAASQHGLVNNHMVGLEDEEQNLIRKHLPGVDTDKILILLDDRSPASDLLVGFLKYGGGAMVAAGILLAIYARVALKKPVT